LAPTAVRIGRGDVWGSTQRPSPTTVSGSLRVESSHPPWAGRTLDARAWCLIRPGSSSIGSALSTRRESNGHLRIGQRPLLGRMLPNFTGRPLQAVPPRGAAADESAGTCGADSPLPSGRVQRSNTQHPPTIVTDIPGASCSPPPGTQMSTPNPANSPWVAGRIYAVREPRIIARGGTGIAKMMRGSHALSGPAPNREPNKRLRATENDDDGIAYGHHCCGSLA
jgi:hypothetical protein